MFYALFFYVRSCVFTSSISFALVSGIWRKSVGFQKSFCTSEGDELVYLSSLNYLSCRETGKCVLIQSGRSRSCGGGYFWLVTVWTEERQNLKYFSVIFVVPLLIQRKWSINIPRRHWYWRVTFVSVIMRLMNYMFHVGTWFVLIPRNLILTSTWSNSSNCN